MPRAYNPGPRNRLIPLQDFLQQRQEWERKGEQVCYRGSSYHKRKPQIWGLQRANPPRPDASKCEDLTFIAQASEQPDTRNLTNLRQTIQELLQEAFRRGTFSAGQERGWPSCLWVITANEEIAEAQRGVRGSGEYHGYPFNGPEELKQEIQRRWSQNNDANQTGND